MDIYASWNELCINHSEGHDFLVDRRLSEGTQWLVAAPHGGGIEPGTTEIARTVAESEMSFYSFTGLMPIDNKVLHITSARFDEPQLRKMSARHERVLAIHGCDNHRYPADISVWVGGADTELINKVIAALSNSGFKAALDHYTPGGEPNNFCNGGTLGYGLQLELTEMFRRQLFADLTRMGRQKSKPRLEDFAAVVRSVLRKAI